MDRLYLKIGFFSSIGGGKVFFAALFSNGRSSTRGIV
jgi:hypothetical protein